MRARVRFGAAALLAVVICGGGAAAFVFWPTAHLGAPGDALAHVVVPRFAGQLAGVDVRSGSGAKVPVALRDGDVVPTGTVGSGERVSVELTMRRPGWAAWLVGDTDRRRFTVVTPRAHLLGRWLQVRSGGAVTVTFDRTVSLVSLAASPRGALRARRAPCRSGWSQPARTPRVRSTSPPPRARGSVRPTPCE